MPARRDEHGNIIEEPTEVRGRSAAPTRRRGRRSGGPRDEPKDRADREGSAGYGAATRLASGSSGEGGEDRHEKRTKPKSGSSREWHKDPYGKPTVPMDGSPEESGPTKPDDSGPPGGRGRKTEVYRPKPDRPPIYDPPPDPPRLDPMNDPPVGWLVVIRGPGRGKVATLGIGGNTIGRGPENRVPLGDGDGTISRSKHCAITYDPLNRQFYIQHGDGKNLTYVGSEPVLGARVLEPFTHVRMGETVLRFVPLCSDGFSWEEGQGE